MKNFKNPIVGLVFFSVFIGLVVLAHGGIIDSYHVTESSIQTIEVGGVNQTGNIGQQIMNLNLISGVQGVSNGLIKLVPGAGSTFDLIGGLMSIGIGAIKSVFGLLSIPIEIMFIITSYYGLIIPEMIQNLTIIVTVIAGFILVKLFVGSEV